MEKVEFGSREWVAAMRRVFEESVADRDLTGIEFSMGEEFTDPPAHLRREGSDTIGWHVRVRDGKVEVIDGPAADLDMRIVADYAMVLPMARVVMADQPDDEARQKITAENMSKLRIEGDPTKLPPGFMESLGIHDKLAVITA